LLARTPPGGHERGTLRGEDAHDVRTGAVGTTRFADRPTPTDWRDCAVVPAESGWRTDANAWLLRMKRAQRYLTFHAEHTVELRALLQREARVDAWTQGDHELHRCDTALFGARVGRDLELPQWIAPSSIDIEAVERATTRAQARANWIAAIRAESPPPPQTIAAVVHRFVATTLASHPDHELVPHTERGKWKTAADDMALYLRTCVSGIHWTDNVKLLIYDPPAPRVIFDPHRDAWLRARELLQSLESIAEHLGHAGRFLLTYDAISQIDAILAVLERQRRGEPVDRAFEVAWIERMITTNLNVERPGSGAEICRARNGVAIRRDGCTLRPIGVLVGGRHTVALGLRLVTTPID
jgi:hypothetical protein